MIENIQQITVKAIFEKDNHVLLLKDRKDIWELPGGRIEHNEHIEDALKREIMEELSWENIKINKILNAFDFDSKTEKAHKHFIVLVYACETNDFEIKSNNEFKEYKWFALNEIKDLNIRDGYKASIKKFFENK